jgi:hypothetical protein
MSIVCFAEGIMQQTEAEWKSDTKEGERLPTWIEKR